ncbi:MAG: MotA/TolQ/ExbB proton channel family protein [Waddliaceae bacterium]
MYLTFFVNNLFVSANPFYRAYIHADLLGKLIFLSLLLLSVLCWSLLIYKVWETQSAEKASSLFFSTFQSHRTKPLKISYEKGKFLNPFFELYQVLQKHTVDLLDKNHHFSKQSFLSAADINLVESHLMAQISHLTKKLEENLFFLSTIVGLAPLLGLLGTVWGILTTFSDLNSPGMGGSNQAMLSGLSLALTTTVLGLLNAIPALIAYNALKSRIHRMEVEMEGFSTEILACVEMQYRKVEN